MTVDEIVRAYLENNGLDGLVSPDKECGCVLGDLAPCSLEGLVPLDCRAGKLIPCPGDGCWAGDGCEWHIKAVEVESGKGKDA